MRHTRSEPVPPELAERLDEAERFERVVVDYLDALDKFRQPYRQTAANAPYARDVKRRKAARLWKAEQHLREYLSVEVPDRYPNNMDVLDDGPARYLDRQPECAVDGCGLQASARDRGRLVCSGHNREGVALND